MKTILKLNASLFGGDAQSSRLGSDFVAALQRHAGPGLTKWVTVRDLAAARIDQLAA